MANTNSQKLIREKKRRIIIIGGELRRMEYLRAIYCLCKAVNVCAFHMFKPLSSLSSINKPFSNNHHTIILILQDTEITHFFGLLAATAVVAFNFVRFYHQLNFKYAYICVYSVHRFLLTNLTGH